MVDKIMTLKEVSGEDFMVYSDLETKCYVEPKAGWMLWKDQ